MRDDSADSRRRIPFGKRTLAGLVIGASVATAGVAVGATVIPVKTTGAGEGRAVIDCPGGMSRLGHPFDRDMSIFPGDPEVEVDVVYTVADDFFKVEAIRMGPHAGTHLDAPAHFIEDGRSIDQLAAEEFVWPAYKIVVSELDIGEDGLVEKNDIKAYEDEHGRIKPGSLVILQTGAEEYFGLDGPGDERHSQRVGNPHGNINPLDLSDNTDDLFDFANAGFSGDAVQWMFDQRGIDGVGSDAYGPDAASDLDFNATYTTLLNDGVALVALANLDSVNVRSDVIVASGIALTDGSGFSTDPIACHGAPPAGDD